MQTDTSVELILLEDIDEPIPCEHQQHSGYPAWHADGDEHYIKLIDPCGHIDDKHVHVYCQKWLSTSVILQCPQCLHIYPLAGHCIDLGLVKDYK